MSLASIGIGIVIGAKVGNAVANIQKVDDALKKTKRRTKGLGSAFTGISEGFNRIRSGVMPFAAAGGVAAALGVNEAIKFEKQILRVGAVFGNEFSDARRAQLEQFSKSIALDPTIVGGARDAASGIELLAKSGVRTDKALRSTLPIAMKMAGNEAIETSRSVKILVGTVKQFGLDVEKDAQRVADNMTKAADAANTNVAEMSSGLRFIGPVARQMGLELEDVTASMALLAESGLTAGLAGRGMAAMFSTLVTPQAQKMLKKANVSLTDTAGNFKQMPQLITELSYVLDQIPNASDRSAAALKLFGQRGQRVFFNLAQRGGDALKEMIDNIDRSTVTVDSKAKTMAQGIDAMSKKIKNSLGVIAIEFFGQLAGPGGAVTSMRDFTGEVAKAMVLAGQLGDQFNSSAALANGISMAAYETAQGVRKAATEVNEFFTGVGQTLSGFKRSLEENGLGPLAKFVAKFIALSPVLLPVMFGLGSVLNILAGFSKVLIGIPALVSGLGAAFGGLATAVAAVNAVIRGQGLAQLGTLIPSLIPLVGALEVKLGGMILTMMKLGVGGSIVAGLKALAVLPFKMAAGFLAAIGPIGWVVGALGALKLALDADEDSYNEMIKKMEAQGNIVFTNAEKYKEFVKAMKNGQKHGVGLKTTIGELTTFQQKLKDVTAGTASESDAMADAALQAAIKIKQAAGDMKGAAALMNEAAALASQANYNSYFQADDRGEGGEAGGGGGFVGYVGQSKGKKDSITQRNVDRQKTLADRAAKREIVVKSNLNLDGRCAAGAVSKAQLEVAERAGAKVKPYQRRAVIERGAMPA